jgi:DNA polymerase-1
LGVRIITGDRDLLQLVDERVTVNLSGSKLAEAKDYTPSTVKEVLGVRPDQVVDFKALIGDKSDNIPGVHGVGEKTALTIMEKYHTLDEIYAHLEEYPERIRKLLEQGKKDAYLSYDLSRIRTDLSVTLNLEQAQVGDFNYPLLVELFKELEFRSLLTRIQPAAAVIPSLPAHDQLSLFWQSPIRIGTSPRYEIKTILVDSPEKLQELQKVLSKSKVISFDTETTSTDPMQASLVGVSLAVQEGEGYYIPVGHAGGQPNMDMTLVLDSLRPSFTDQDIQKVGHNLKYDALVLRNHGLIPAPLNFDTMIAAWLTDPSTRRLGLKDIAEIELDASMTHIEELIGSGKNQRSMAEIAIGDVAPYAAADAEIPLRLQPLLDKRMQEHNVSKVFYEMEMPLAAVLEEMRPSLKNSLPNSRSV